MAKEITQPTDEQIRTRAYYLWEADGRPHGRDWEYWMKAQQEFARASAEIESNPISAPSQNPVAAVAQKKPAAGGKRRIGTRAAVYA